MTDWLQKFEIGGQLNDTAKKLVSLIGKSYKEIQSGKPGEATQQLLQIMQDPQGGQMLSDLAQQMPEVGEALSVITQTLQQMMEAQGQPSLEKGGELTSMGQGGCNCGTHKKLFRLGGKICQIEVDCNDNIITK